MAKRKYYKLLLELNGFVKINSLPEELKEYAMFRRSIKLCCTNITETYIVLDESRWKEFIANKMMGIILETKAGEVYKYSESLTRWFTMNGLTKTTRLSEIIETEKKIISHIRNGEYD